MAYVRRCRCGELLYFDELPAKDDNIPFLCWECQRKARYFKAKRRVVKKLRGDEPT
jgi:hypothetical protein